MSIAVLSNFLSIDSSLILVLPLRFLPPVPQKPTLSLNSSSVRGIPAHVEVFAHGSLVRPSVAVVPLAHLAPVSGRHLVLPAVLVHPFTVSFT